MLENMIGKKTNEVWYSLSVITNLFEAKYRKIELFLRENTSIMYRLIARLIGMIQLLSISHLIAYHLPKKMRGQ